MNLDTLWGVIVQENLMVRLFGVVSWILMELGTSSPPLPYPKSPALLEF